MESVHKYLSIAINRLAQIIRSACVSLLVGPVCFCWKITRKIDSSIYVDVKLLQIQSVIASSKCFYVRLGDTVVCNLNGSQHYWRDSSNFNASLHGRIFSVEFLTQCEISVSEYIRLVAKSRWQNAANRSKRTAKGNIGWQNIYTLYINELLALLLRLMTLNITFQRL